MNWIKRAWRGEEKLWKVFWIYGFVLNIAFGLLTDFLVVLGLPVWCYAILRLVYGFWIMVCEWRCAFNAKWRIWGYLIRAIIAFGVIGMVLCVGFMAVTGNWKILQGQLYGAMRCQDEIKAYMAKGGKDVEAFSQQCIDKTMGINDDKASAPTAPDSPQPDAAAMITVTSAPDDKDRMQCERDMTDYATKNGGNPQQYIAQNQAYLQQCIQYYKSKEAK